MLSEVYTYDEIYGGLTTNGEYKIIDLGGGGYSIGTSDIFLRKLISIHGVEVEVELVMFG